MYVVDNAVIMAAGTSSRFAPLSYEKPKALITVKGEVLIERQIRQLIEAGITSIYIVVGYKAELFSYLEEKYGVHLVMNSDYLIRNNNASIYAVKDILRNTYICSADNYFSENPFEKTVSDCYYSAVYAHGPTQEWCIQADQNDMIQSVHIGGKDEWYMLGHAFWSDSFSRKFVEILEREYDLPGISNLLWESIYLNHLDELSMKIRRYHSGIIFEFDTLDELREFDESYILDARSEILSNIARELNCRQRDIRKLTAFKDATNAAAGFTFEYSNLEYAYSYHDHMLRRIL